MEDDWLEAAYEDRNEANHFEPPYDPDDFLPDDDDLDDAGEEPDTLFDTEYSDTTHHARSSDDMAVCGAAEMPLSRTLFAHRVTCLSCKSITD